MLAFAEIGGPKTAHAERISLYDFFPRISANGIGAHFCGRWPPLIANKWAPNACNPTSMNFQR
jgi:hypothetical protein